MSTIDPEALAALKAAAEAAPKGKYVYFADGVYEYELRVIQGETHETLRTRLLCVLPEDYDFDSYMPFAEQASPDVILALLAERDRLAEIVEKAERERDAALQLVRDSAEMLGDKSGNLVQAITAAEFSYKTMADDLAETSAELTTLRCNHTMLVVVHESATKERDTLIAERDRLAVIVGKLLSTAKSLDGLLAYYRIGKRPSEKVLASLNTKNEVFAEAALAATIQPGEGGK